MGGLLVLLDEGTTGINFTKKNDRSILQQIEQEGVGK
jgi:hypothetical protein